MSSKKTKTYKSFSSEETKKFGEKIAKDFASKKRAAAAGALIFALKGDLGAGKTTFTQGFIKGLGSKRRATSPTFVIMRRHALKKGLHNKQFVDVFHIDAYRLKTSKNLSDLGFDKIAENPANIIIIEWPERVKKALPKGAVRLTFGHGKKENERKIILRR